MDLDATAKKAADDFGDWVLGWSWCWGFLSNPVADSTTLIDFSLIGDRGAGGQHLQARHP